MGDDRPVTRRCSARASESMGQGQRAGRQCPDTVITGAVIIDYWGIIKADIDSLIRIVGIGKAGNSDIMTGASGSRRRPSTKIISASAESSVSTVDCHKI